MVLRREPRYVVAIGQQSHAWISGQLARAWGNERFGTLEPREEVCLAAEQHDLGMAAWDLSPSLDPRTGLPHSFMEMPLDTHLELWRTGPPRLVSQSRYAALLASIHGSRLYEARDLAKLSAADAAAVRAFLERAAGFQSELLASLGDDPRTAAAAAPERVARNSQLLWTWDFASLALCLDWAPCTAHQVPAAAGPAELRIIEGPQPGQLIFDPWPFTAGRVAIRCEGRVLTGRCADDEQLTATLAAARWETVEFELVPPSR